LDIKDQIIKSAATDAARVDYVLLSNAPSSVGADNLSCMSDES